jgi:hypothetical protein
MNITIEQEKLLHSLVRTNKVLWQLYSRSFKKYVIIMGILGVGLIIFNSFTPYTMHTQSEGKEIYYNINISFSIGLALILLALIYLRHMLRNKTLFFELADKHIGKNPLQKNGDVEITEQTIKINSNNSSHEFSWKYFSHFKFKDEILFLLADDSYLNAVAVPKSLIDKKEFDELMMLVEKRLIEKR